MACIYLLNSHGGPQSFDFDITYLNPIIVPPYPWLYNFNSGIAAQKRISIVVLNLALPSCADFPCLKIFPLHNFN